MGKVPKRRVLIIGGGFSGLLAARDLSSKYDVTVVDAKEFFEYTPGILRAYVKPCHFDALSFTLNDVIEHKIGCKFIWGEVKGLNGSSLTATVKPMIQDYTEEIGFDYCVIASGCNFNFMHKFGESLWFPTVHQQGREHSEWKHIDERYIEGRRRHILEENQKLKDLNKKAATVLICGAGFIGVEWATELQYFFPKLKITVIDFLPNCLGPLPVKAQEYCDTYMAKVGIKTVYGIKYDPKSSAFWQKIGLQQGSVDETYICMGVKASNYFMPKETLSDKGPGGGGWIYINKKLQVTTANGEVWGKGVVFAVGDCNYGCVGSPAAWELHPIPKISYPAEEQATQVVKSINVLDHQVYRSGGCTAMCCMPSKPKDTWWPWGAGMFATSLGPHDACFVLAANHKPKSGFVTVWGWPCAIQKELIETTKVNECKMGLIGILIWHFVHHTPMHLFGDGTMFKF